MPSPNKQTNPKKPNGLQQLEKRSKELKTLLRYLKEHSNTALGQQHYSTLLQQKIDAVLAYKNITQHWPTPAQTQAKTLIDEIIQQHQQWKEQLEIEHQRLQKKLNRLETSPRHNKQRPTYKYNTEEGSRLVNLQG